MSAIRCGRFASAAPVVFNPPKAVAKMSGSVVKSIDTTQANYLDEKCILVDNRDNIRGSMAKGDCHRWQNIVKGDTLHRAFSVFAWDANGHLLLQRRAGVKVTFPNVWTNACCSHPLFDVGDESEGVQGVIAAARRKLQHELGIQSELLPPTTLHCVTRVIYKSRDPVNTEWGEHELDYCLTAKFDESVVNAIKINENEVGSVKFVSMDELRTMLADGQLSFSPWFKLIEKLFLRKWWAESDTLSFDEKIHDWTQ